MGRKPNCFSASSASDRQCESSRRTLYLFADVHDAAPEEIEAVDDSRPPELPPAYWLEISADGVQNGDYRKKNWHFELELTEPVSAHLNAGFTARLPGFAAAILLRSAVQVRLPAAHRPRQYGATPLALRRSETRLRFRAILSPFCDRTRFSPGSIPTATPPLGLTPPQWFSIIAQPDGTL